MRGLRQLDSDSALRQFVALWSQVRQIQLRHQPDSIPWRFNGSGTYSSQSAYNSRFQGTDADLQWMTIWKAQVEKNARYSCGCCCNRDYPQIIESSNEGDKLILFARYAEDGKKRHSIWWPNAAMPQLYGH
ncbi:hypothetical protein HU200_050397 [Digitaria exilis]|uniref:Uncharacterized protein n=1 Tax=Digitaria exilis TaxID=1010633 RepID=A0A835E5Y3_9POAL|nr:hypothetical protein HU200_050397 [Digitaria exilis]